MKLAGLAAFLFYLMVLPPALGKSLDRFNIYDDTYFIMSHTFSINEDVYRDANDTELSTLNNFETKYQFSFSIPIFKFGNKVSAMASYTQLSLWQLGNSKVSAPFRETNYQPQLFIMHHSHFHFFNSIEYGYRHQSNGRGGEISRSWERLYISIEKNNSSFEYGVQAWLALEVSDNDDIEDYIPPYFVWVKFRESLDNYKVKLFHNFDSNRNGIEFSYEHEINDVINFYAQIWSGYGETLIDYNHNQTRVGVGVSIQPWR